jgi:UMF1 family MFS transporter
MDNRKKIQRAWSMYDWANSVYNLVITSTIFPAYYVAVTSSNSDEQSYVNFFGYQFINTALLNYALAIVFLIVAVTSPILSSGFLSSSVQLHVPCSFFSPLKKLNGE